MEELNPAMISAAAGSLVSIFLFLVQMFYPKFAGIPDHAKQGVNVLSTAAVVAGIALLSCYTEVVVVSCTQLAIADLIFMALGAVMGNAATFVTFNHSAKKAAEFVPKKQ